MLAGKSFADDLILEQGIVSSRVALLLRSAEIKPFCSSDLSGLREHSGVPIWTLRFLLFFFLAHPAPQAFGGATDLSGQCKHSGVPSWTFAHSAVPAPQDFGVAHIRLHRANTRGFRPGLWRLESSRFHICFLAGQTFRGSDLDPRFTFRQTQSAVLTWTRWFAFLLAFQAPDASGVRSGTAHPAPETRGGSRQRGSFLFGKPRFSQSPLRSQKSSGERWIYFHRSLRPTAFGVLAGSCAASSSPT